MLYPNCAEKYSHSHALAWPPSCCYRPASLPSLLAETLAKMYFINVPAFFSMGFAMIKPFLDERVRVMK